MRARPPAHHPTGCHLPTPQLGTSSPPTHWVPQYLPSSHLPGASTPAHHPPTHRVPEIPPTHPRVPQHHPPIHWMSQRHHPPTHPVPAKRVHLLRQPRLRLGVGCQQVQREGQGVGRRLVARRNERVALGAGVGWGGVSWGGARRRATGAACLAWQRSGSEPVQDDQAT